MPAQTPIPRALVRMLPYGHAARLALQILKRTDALKDALSTLLHTEDCCGMDRATLHHLAGILADFQHVLAAEAEHTKDSPHTAPLTGTSARSIVHALAEVPLTMPEPNPDNGGWRQAVHDRIWLAGNRYAQIWAEDATYWKYADQQEQTKEIR